VAHFRFCISEWLILETKTIYPLPWNQESTFLSSRINETFLAGSRISALRRPSVAAIRGGNGRLNRRLGSDELSLICTVGIRGTPAPEPILRFLFAAVE